ncbi:MAG TPA: RIP metalloprotease RseP [Stellaceae bacterium]|jgi:regulator of sigma E protease|nr:RIP metalloprotease RseP [Stellaceae bacterium]
MSILTGGLGYIIPFLVVLTVLVFVHELGHYLVARRNGVRIEVFSIGFGPEIFGWYDRAGTRWKLSAVPLGGYVKMYGDADASSLPSGSLEAMSLEDREFSFHHKRLGQRVAVVAAGPAANFIFAIVLLAGLFMTVGQPFTPPDVGQVQPGSAAERGGIKPGDTIAMIDGRKIDRFEDVQQAVALNNGGPMAIVVHRDGRDVSLDVTPQMTERTDRFGNVHRVGLLGIGRSGVEYVRHNPATAVVRAAEETWNLSAGTLKAIWQMIVGARTTDELGGPLRIAQMSGEVAQGGIVAIVWFMAVLSVNLGLINLFPIPVLDGGHLLFYVAEAIRGRPLGQRAQEYGFRIGLALVLTLMVFATWNDLMHLYASWTRSAAL